MYLAVTHGEWRDDHLIKVDCLLQVPQNSGNKESFYAIIDD